MIEERYSDTFFTAVEGKKLHYGKNVRNVIDLITRVGSNVRLDETRVFGKHIHAFAWCFFTGLNEDIQIELGEGQNYEYTDTFSFAIYKNDFAEIVADTMLMVALADYQDDDLEKAFTSQVGIRKILNIISSYAEGGAQYILDRRNSDDIIEQNYLNSIGHFFDELKKRSNINS